MNFLSNLGSSIVSGFKSALAPLLPQGFFTSGLPSKAMTADIFSKATSLSAPSKVDTGLSVTGLTPSNYQPGNVFTQPGGQVIGQVNPQASGVITNPSAFTQNIQDFNQSIRPLITTQPAPILQDPTLNTSFSGAYQSPEQKAFTQQQQQAQKQGLSGLPGVGWSSATGMPSTATTSTQGATGFTGA